MGAIIGLIVSLAPSIIALVQKLVPSNAGHGQTKADAVNAAIAAALASLQAKGMLPPGIDTVQVATVVETIFQQMLQTGQVNPPVIPTPGPAPAGGDFIFTFKKGQLISVG